MKTVFKGKRIAGIMTVLPQNEIKFEDELKNYTFAPSQSMRLKKVMGYEKHRVVKSETATSDLCVFGLQHMLDTNIISKEEIGAIVVVTVTPDYFIPHVSNIVQGACNLSTDILCLDISQGCCGFLIGLMESFMLLDLNPNKKIVLINADTLSKKVSIHDRNSYPLIGDAATITILENDTSAKDIYFNMRMDGSRGDTLIIPAGGSRLPCSPETAKMVDSGDGNLRSKDNLTMDGTGVFTFVQTDVPPLILETLKDAGLSREDIDWYIFHQPNRFMLQKLADKLEISRDKVFMNIVTNYGNPSGSSIPLAITHNLGSNLLDNTYSCCLSAFGSGLGWGVMTLNLGKLDFCEMLISKC